jgi:hypothetical protein
MCTRSCPMKSTKSTDSHDFRTRPNAALGAYSTCNEFAAVTKRIACRLNTSLRASEYLQITGNKF